MEKKTLEQYASLIAEREDLQRRIHNTELRMEQLYQEEVADSVTLGKRGKKPLGRKVIRGMPTEELKRKRIALRRYKSQLKSAEEKIGTMIIDVEQYISEIDDSRIRRIFRYRYIDKLTWVQVSIRMGRHYTAESCRKTAERYFQEK